MKQLTQWIKLVRFARNLELPLWIGGGAMMAAWLTALWIPSAAWAGLGIGLAALGAGFIPRRTAAQTAADLDREFGSANRFESALELAAGADHPLRAAQQADALAFRDGMPKRHFKLWWRIALTLLVFLALFAGLASRAKFAKAPETAAPGEVKPDAPATAEAAKETPPFRLNASIALIYPEEDAEFTPIDLLEYEAKAESNAPWERFRVAIGHNGKQVRLLKPEVSRTESNIAFPAGAFSLDELEAAPHDLVTLRISGVTAGKEIVAPALYLRLKPLREDVVIDDIPPGAQETVDRIRDFIRRQLTLGKLLDLGRNAFAADPAVDIAPFAELSGEQGKLAGDVSTFVREERDKPDTRMTTDMFRCLNDAAEEMETAAARIGKIPLAAPRFAEGAAAQERAAAHLNKALREVIRAISRKQSKDSSPSQDRPKPKPGDENPGDLLKKALEKEQEVVTHAAAPELPPSAADVQGAVSWLLRMVAARGEIAEPVKRETETALDSSLKSEEAIRSAARNTLKLRAEETVRSIERALAELKKDAAANAESSAGDARTELAEAEREAAKQQSDPAGETPQQKMDEAAKLLRDAAARDRASGSGEQAAKLDEMAKLVEDAAKDAAKRPGAALASELRDLRGRLGEIIDPENGKDPGRTAEKLDALAREGTYRAKRQDWQHADRWRNDLEQTLEGAMRYWKNSGKRPPEVSENMPLNNLLVDFNPDKGYSPDEMKRLIGLLEIIRQALEAEALKQNLPTALYQFQPDRIPEEFREAAAKYFEALSRLRNTHDTK